MAPPLRSTIRGLSWFLIGRYPFINAITLLLLLGERAARESYPPLEPKIIYAHLAVFIVCGICMGFNFGRKSACLVHVGQLLMLASSLYMNENLKYRRWVTIRMAFHLVGVAGTMMMYAFFTMRKPRDQHLRRIGEILWGVYIVCLTYTLVESPEDRNAFTHHIPGGDTSVYIYALLLGASAMCLLPGLFVYDISWMLIVVLIIHTGFVTADINYWTHRRGMDYWNQIRLIADSSCIITGLMMYASCMSRNIHPKEE